MQIGARHGRRGMQYFHFFLVLRATKDTEDLSRRNRVRTILPINGDLNLPPGKEIFDEKQGTGCTCATVDI